MAAKPWYTSDDLIAAVKRKISFPVSQNTFSDEDILAFANEELMISQVPSVLQYHEEYFVTNVDVPLKDNTSRYPIPERAIGQRLRDLFWKDSSGNLFEMTRISSDDRAFFQRNIGANMAIHKFYFEGNDVVLTPQVVQGPSGRLNFVFFLRPNQLVPNERAAIINSFVSTVTLDNAQIVAGDTITINDVTFTAVAGAPSSLQFQIGLTSIQTATNLVTAINTNGTYSAENGTTTTNVVNIMYDSIPTTLYGNTVQFIPMVTTSNTNGFNINAYQGIKFDSVPDNITHNSIIDFLQTKPGHKMRGYDREIQVLSGDIAYFNITDVPIDLVVGDYICLANECIIPQIPSDLHNALAERTCARILAAIGDQQGLATVNQKLQEIESRQGTIVDDRSEGTPQKITARHSLLRYGKMGHRRRV